jgi:hypothetical protein
VGRSDIPHRSFGLVSRNSDALTCHCWRRAS